MLTFAVSIKFAIGTWTKGSWQLNISSAAVSQHCSMVTVLLWFFTRVPNWTTSTHSYWRVLLVIQGGLHWFLYFIGHRKENSLEPLKSWLDKSGVEWTLIYWQYWCLEWVEYCGQIRERRDWNAFLVQRVELLWVSRGYFGRLLGLPGVCIFFICCR